MDSNPKLPAWGSLSTSSRPPIQPSKNRGETNLPLDTWPELPSKGSPKSTSSTLVPCETPPSKCGIPKRSLDKVTSRSTESSPTPRPRPTYSEVLHLHPNRPSSQGNDPGAFRSLGSPTSRSKVAPSKPSLSMPPVSQTHVRPKMSSISKTTVIEPVPFCNVTALQTSIRQDPRATFAYIQSLVGENNELKDKVKSMEGQLEFEQQHLKKTVHDYEELQSIGKAKHYVLWTFIQRLTAGETSPHTSVSEPATNIEAPRGEGSLPQIEQSMDNIKLDPHAQTFTPSASTSPARFQNHGSNTSTPGTSNSQVFIATPLTPTRLPSHTTLFNMPTPISPSILEAIIKSIPALFRSVCPFSLTGSSCPIYACQMKRLCPRFNDHSGLSTCPSRQGCRHLHEHPTCLGEAEGVGCGFAPHGNQTPKGKGRSRNRGKDKMGEMDEPRKIHFKCFVHQRQCGPEEWRLRLVIAGLRQAHREGAYKN